jgi:hypothetical protein
MGRGEWSEALGGELPSGTPAHGAASGGRSVQSTAYGRKCFSWRVNRSGTPGRSPAALRKRLKRRRGGVNLKKQHAARR